MLSEKGYIKIEIFASKDWQMIQSNFWTTFDFSLELGAPLVPDSGYGFNDKDETGELIYESINFYGNISVTIKFQRIYVKMNETYWYNGLH